MHNQAPAARRGGWLSAARRTAARIGAPPALLDADHVYPRLWIGARPPVDSPLPGYSLVALCAGEYQPTDLAFRGAVVRARLRDAAPTPDEMRAAAAAATQVAAALRRGGRCLVTCHAGLNRSAFVAGLALIQVCRMPADEMIVMFRRCRSEDVLHNPHFVEILRRFSAVRRSRTR